MAENPDHIEIPSRALFRTAEVCDLVKVQSYVLRSWEAEFPGLGVAKSVGGPRLYRRADVERVLRIKHLLRVEGLTLAGVRRRLEEELAPVAADAPVIDELIGRNARERLTDVKLGLRAILEMLAGGRSAREFKLAPPRAAPAARPVRAGRVASSGRKGAAPSRAATSRRKRRQNNH